LAVNPADAARSADGAFGRRETPAALDGAPARLRF